MFWQVDPSNLEPGTMVDGWRIIRRIDSGGFGTVYEVEKDGKRCAMKKACPSEGRRDAQVDARALREANCLGNLHHPHIIRMWAQGRWPDPLSGVLYIVVDLVDGYTLGEWVRRAYPTLHEVVVLFMKLFDALEYMHGKSVFHRDLSLRNILVTKQGEPVIIDFGASDHAASDELTDAALPPGTTRNRSPEALKFWKENHLNPEARYLYKATDDIFALGANLYDVLTNPTPDLSQGGPALNGRFAPPAPSKVSEGRVPMELSDYVMMLLHPQPEERPATAKHARAPLEEFAKMEGWRSTRVHPIAAQLPPVPYQVAPVEGQGESLEELVPSHPSPLRGGWAAALHRLRRGWLRPAWLGPLALAVVVAAVAISRMLPEAAPSAAPPQGAAPIEESIEEPLEEPPVPADIPAEKPTNLPAQLPSPLPTQQEASPVVSSVKQPENSPTLTSRVPAAQQASPRRTLSKAQRCALLVFTAAWLEAGCVGVQKKPDPEPCPQKAIDAMQDELGWRLNGGAQAAVIVDVTKGGMTESLGKPGCCTTFKDGPMVGELARAEGKAPKGTRLEGHLWTTGDKVYGRYHRAILPGGRTVPVCMELRSGGTFGLDKSKGSKPGEWVASKETNAWAVDHWE